MVGMILMSACTFSPPALTSLAVSASGRPVPELRPARFSDFDAQQDVPDRIMIPAIDLETSVVELGWRAAVDPSGRVFSNWDVASYAAGWHTNSGKLGEGGNVVLSGHNNIQGAVFRELDRLSVGDVATVWSNDVPFEYKIEKVLIVPESTATHEQRVENGRWIGEFGDDRLTLVSCWPRDGNSHRIIAVGYAIDNDDNGDSR